MLKNSSDRRKQLERPEVFFLKTQHPVIPMKAKRIEAIADGDLMAGEVGTY